jgi:hypothetical protein
MGGFHRFSFDKVGLVRNAMDDISSAFQERAVRFRRIAAMMSDPETISALRAMAAECDKQAEAVERRGARGHRRH